MTNILLTLLLVFLNGFFVAAEFAIVKVRTSQLEVKLQSGDKLAKLAKQIVSNLDAYLAATQLGITLASLGLGWIGEPVVSKIILSVIDLTGLEMSEALAHRIALPIAFAFITILHIVFGELAPKSLAIQRSEKTALAVAYPLQFFYVVFRPFIWVLNGIANFILKGIGISAVHGTEVHSSQEIQFLVHEGQKSGEIDEEEYKIIKNVFEFSEQSARQVMVPRTQIFAIDTQNFTGEFLEKVIEENYSRIPCYEGSIDNITGVIYLKELLKTLRKGPIDNLHGLIREVLFVPETKSIGKLLNEFQAEHQQIAIVINEYGGTEGLITMEDILEELVGEIQDEYDEESPAVEKINADIFNISGTLSIDDVNEVLPRPIEKDNQYETLAGYLILKFGKIPSTKDKIVLDQYEFSILKKNKRSITLVQIKDLDNKDNDAVQ